MGGGKSTGSWSEGEGYGILDGEVVDVPSLSAPGFIKAAADGKFPDISKFIDGNLVLSVRSSTPEYQGYRVTFVSGALSADFACAGGGSLPFSRGCSSRNSQCQLVMSLLTSSFPSTLSATSGLLLQVSTQLNVLMIRMSA